MRRRPLLLSALSDRGASSAPRALGFWCGPPIERAVRARNLRAEGTAVVDTDEHLVEMVLGADPDAAHDLRQRALAPLHGLRANTAERLAETLRAWLLHQGQREAVAADLFVHPQTVRYRMNQMRDLYGDRLNDPQTVLELTVALGSVPGS